MDWLSFTWVPQGCSKRPLGSDLGAKGPSDGPLERHWARALKRGRLQRHLGTQERSSGLNCAGQCAQVPFSAHRCCSVRTALFSVHRCCSVRTSYSSAVHCAQVPLNAHSVFKSCSVRTGAVQRAVCRRYFPVSTVAFQCARRYFVRAGAVQRAKRTQVLFRAHR